MLVLEEKIEERMSVLSDCNFLRFNALEKIDTSGVA
jgi:hypothetical protein